MASFRRLAARHAERLGLQVIEPPFDADMPPVQAVRRAGAADPGVDWLLEKVRAALDLPGEGGG